MIEWRIRKEKRYFWNLSVLLSCGFHHDLRVKTERAWFHRKLENSILSVHAGFLEQAEQEVAYLELPGVTERLPAQKMSSLLSCALNHTSHRQVAPIKIQTPELEDVTLNHSGPG